MAKIAIGTINRRSWLAVVLMSYKAAASPATPLSSAPERSAACETTSPIAGVAFIAAVDCWEPAAGAASNWTILQSAEMN